MTAFTAIPIRVPRGQVPDAVGLLEWVVPRREPVQGVGEGVVTREVVKEPLHGPTLTRDLGEQGVENLPVSARQCADRVEGRQHEPLLLKGQVDVEHRHPRFTAGDRQSHPGMSVDHMAGRLVHDDPLDPSHPGQHALELLLLVQGMHPPVHGVGKELVGRLVAFPDDPVAPCLR